jgi:Domain of unknown function (DUF5753)
VAEVDARLAVRAALSKNLPERTHRRTGAFSASDAAGERRSAAVMAEQLEYLLEWARTMHHLVIQVLPWGSKAHEFMGWTHTAAVRPARPGRAARESSARDLFFDGEAEVREVAEKLELMKGPGDRSQRRWH